MFLKPVIITIVLYLSESFATELSCAENGYTETAGIGWYKFHAAAQNWSEAVSTCTDEGAHLVIINDEDEQKAINDIFDKNYENIKGARRTDLIWLGANDLLSGNWVTLLLEPLSYVNWSRGCDGYPAEPNHLENNEHCLSLYRRCDRGFNDYRCDLKLAFVCEKPATCL